ncbi:MAG: hypothetical protein ACYSWU_18715 [Planctomycetota bacterium]|jgi:hypothetical protein
MAIDLFSEVEGWFRFDVTEWKHVLELAEQHGWKPMGTQASDRGPDFPRPEDWDGGYFTSDYQTVTVHDARNLADALERAIPDLPSHPVSPLERFGGQEGPKHVREFINFCRAGEFVIG